MVVFDFIFPKKKEITPLFTMIKNPAFERAELIEKINRKYWFSFRIQRNTRRLKPIRHHWQPLKLYSPSDGLIYWLEKPKGEQDCD